MMPQRATPTKAKGRGLPRGVTEGCPPGGFCERLKPSKEDEMYLL